MTGGEVIAWIERHQDESVDVGPVWWAILVFTIGVLVGVVLGVVFFL